MKKGLIINIVQVALGAATLAVGFIKNQATENEQRELIVDTATQTANKAVANMFNEEG